MAKKKNVIKEVQPKAVKLNTDVDLNEIGEKRIIVVSDAPKVKSKSKGAGGKVSTEFATVGEDGSTIRTMDVLQPFIKEADVRKIGIAKWHRYGRKGAPVYTTVINGRRFKMHEPEFFDCKNKGLVIQDG